MEKLNDGIHNCNSCKKFPCTPKDFIDAVPHKDCKTSLILLREDCEQGKYKGRYAIEKKKNGECIYYGLIGSQYGCTIFEKRPIACRV